MIDHQQKGGKKTGAVKLSGVREVSQAKKTRVSDGSDMIVNPELDKYVGDEFIPENINKPKFDWLKVFYLRLNKNASYCLLLINSSNL